MEKADLASNVDQAHQGSDSRGAAGAPGPVCPPVQHRAEEERQYDAGVKEGIVVHFLAGMEVGVQHASAQPDGVAGEHGGKAPPAVHGDHVRVGARHRNARRDEVVLAPPPLVGGRHGEGSPAARWFSGLPGLAGEDPKSAPKMGAESRRKNSRTRPPRGLQQRVERLGVGGRPVRGSPLARPAPAIGCRRFGYPAWNPTRALCARADPGAERPARWHPRAAAGADRAPPNSRRRRALAAPAGLPAASRPQAT
mmetsp:Transcript_91475/g.285126  ORF Transcript_91475/g.285126 Transcript_91475/m.285126 type:complete len:253 (-) Transcript_91475:168-926(-)